MRASLQIGAIAVSTMTNPSVMTGYGFSRSSVVRGCGMASTVLTGAAPASAVWLRAAASVLVMGPPGLGRAAARLRPRILSELLADPDSGSAAR